MRYDAWGSDRYTSGTMQTSYRYTGQRSDAGIGLYYYNARYYDALLGRFSQPDTIVPQPGNPQSLNRYTYVYNNPVKYVDPDGHFACAGSYEGPLMPNIRSCLYRIGFGNRAEAKFGDQMRVSADANGVAALLVAASILRQSDPAWPDRMIGDEPEKWLFTRFNKARSLGLGQITPEEARNYGGLGTIDDLLDPNHSIEYMARKLAKSDAYIKTKSGWNATDQFMLLAMSQNNPEFVQSFFEQYSLDWTAFLFNKQTGKQARDQLWAMLQKIEWLMKQGWQLPPGVDLDEYRHWLNSPPPEAGSGAD